MKNETEELAKELSKFTAPALLKSTREAVQTEKRSTLRVLVHLRELERRRLYVTERTGSLFEFCRKELHYSEPETNLRIAAMRLLAELPQIEDRIEEGALSLTQLNQARTFFNHEAKAGKALDTEAKQDVLKKIEGQSKDETERTLLGLSTEPNRHIKRREGKRNLTKEHAEIRFIADEEFQAELELLRGLLAHRHPDGLGWGELVKAAVGLALEKLDPARKKGRAKPDSSVAPIPDEVAKSRAPSAAQMRELFRQAGSRCMSVDPQTGKRCESQYRLEVDHVIPVSHGGQTELGNLRLLCHSCHRRETLRAFGAEKFDREIRLKRSAEVPD
jgi:hypothetical protein